MKSLDLSDVQETVIENSIVIEISGGVPVIETIGEREVETDAGTSNERKIVTVIGNGSVSEIAREKGTDSGRRSGSARLSVVERSLESVIASLLRDVARGHPLPNARSLVVTTVNRCQRLQEKIVMTIRTMELRQRRADVGDEDAVARTAIGSAVEEEGATRAERDEFV